MNAWEIAATSAGAGLDLFGLALTGIGLFFTWQDHAAGEPFLPAMWAEFTGLVSRLAQRRRRVTTTVGTAWGLAEVTGHVHGVVGFPPGATVEQQILQLKEELDRVSAHAARAVFETEQIRKQVTRFRDETSERLNNLDADVRERLREQTLRGLPLAVLGLALTFVGTLAQVAATLSSA